MDLKVRRALLFCRITVLQHQESLPVADLPLGTCLGSCHLMGGSCKNLFGTYSWLVWQWLVKCLMPVGWTFFKFSGHI